MPTPCYNPKCRACIDIVFTHGTDADYVEYMTMLGKRKIRPKEREAMAKKAADTPYEDRPKAPHITEFEDLVDILPDMCARYRELSGEIAPLEEEKKKLGSDINALLDAVGAKSIRGDGWIAIRIPDTETEALSKEKLLLAGVTLEQLEAGIEKKPKSGYVQVKKAGSDNAAD